VSPGRSEERRLRPVADEMGLIERGVPATERSDYALMGGGVSGGDNRDSDAARPVRFHAKSPNLNELLEEGAAERSWRHGNERVAPFMAFESLQTVLAEDTLRLCAEDDGVSIESEVDLIAGRGFSLSGNRT
jgi:hypothetical protein